MVGHAGLGVDQDILAFGISPRVEDVTQVISSGSFSRGSTKNVSRSVLPLKDFRVDENIPLTGCGVKISYTSASILAELESWAFTCSTTSDRSWRRTRPGRSGYRCRRVRDWEPVAPPTSTNRMVELVVSWPNRFSKSRASKNTGLPSRWILMCACASFNAQGFSARYP